jgi:type VI protein secretion system component Hcp
MVDQPSTDMLMQFNRTGSGGIPAECQLSISPNDKLALESSIAKPFLEGKFFQVSQFSFSAELHDSESGGAGTSGASPRGATPPVHGAARGAQQGQAQGQRGAPGKPMHTGTPRTGHADVATTRAGSVARHADHYDDTAPLGAGKGGTGGGAFSRWRSATGGTWTEKNAYPAYINEFNFTRLIDKATPMIFDLCCKKESLESVTFIKRKAAVARSNLHLRSNESATEELAFMRIDLLNVLIMGVNWSDGDIVQESCRVKCQEMHVTYWQQLANSTLKPIGTATWKSPVIKPVNS